jgi:hypothetical protein
VTKSCKCCGHPSAKDYGVYKACSMCAPKHPEERIIEATMRDGDRARRAKVREMTYRRTSALCSSKIALHRSHVVLEWLE